jgi:hypothetical protein
LRSRCGVVRDRSVGSFGVVVLSMHQH